MRRAATILVPLAVVIACSGNDHSGTAESAPATEDGLLATARAQAEIFASSPADSYDFLSEACQQSINRSDWAGQLLLASSMLESFYGFGLDEMKVQDVEVQSFHGDTGSVLVTATGPNGESLDGGAEAETWRYEDGRWVSDDCELMGSATGPEVSTETALGWPEKFCQLTEDMTREEVRAIMGAPTAEFLDEGSQDQYQAYQFDITIFYDAPRAQDPDPMKVRVRSLDADSTGQFTELTMEDIALFPCADSVFPQRTLDAARANSGVAVLATAELVYDPEFFDPLGAGAAATARLVERDGGVEIVIDDATLPALTDDADLELWLIEADDAGTIVDVAPVALVDGPGTYALPDDLNVTTHRIVDISIEPRDGDDAHSGRSILRGTLTEE